MRRECFDAQPYKGTPSSWRGNMSANEKEAPVGEAGGRSARTAENDRPTKTWGTRSLCIIGSLRGSITSHGSVKPRPPNHLHRIDAIGFALLGRSLQRTRTTQAGVFPVCMYVHVCLSVSMVMGICPRTVSAKWHGSEML